jgi:pimeloyl-ACP methyl ester carboxylesterase
LLADRLQLGDGGRRFAQFGQLVDAALDRIPWFGNAGFRLAGRHALIGQAVRYLTEPTIRDAAIAAIHQHLDDDTRVVLAHSLGSVIAYEAHHKRPQPLPLLITIRSPLGLPSVIRRLQQPPAYPARGAAAGRAPPAR